MKNTAWDWLIVTASNDLQARAYRALLTSRQGSPLLRSFAHWQVVSDPGGKRVGSGGSTLFCLLEIANSTLEQRAEKAVSWKKLKEVLSSLRVMIVHAGGDSRRLPAYAPCGKLFVPIPSTGEQGGEDKGTTLFDRLLEDLCKLPPGLDGRGQYLVVSGDALLLYKPEEVQFNFPGMTAVGVASSLRECTKHGVLCANADRSARLYLQKPSEEKMRLSGALIGGTDQALLDAGLMSFDASFACGMMAAVKMKFLRQGRLQWKSRFRDLTLEKGLDIYREICCALGSESTFENYLESVYLSGSEWEEKDLKTLYHSLKQLPLYCQEVSRCDFLHFGTTYQLITSAQKLCQEVQVAPPSQSCSFFLNSTEKQPGLIQGERYWVEGSQVNAPLHLEGENVLTGVSVNQELCLPKGCCLDMAEGHQPNGEHCWFVRPYGIRDSFKECFCEDGTFCNIPMKYWFRDSGVEPEWIWEDSEGEIPWTLWNAKLFVACAKEEDYRDWLWYFHPETARKNPQILEQFLQAPRYSCASIAQLTDLTKFHERRLWLCQGRQK